MGKMSHPATPYITLLLLTLIVYSSTLANGFIWDDEILIVENPSVGSWRNVPKLFVQSRFQIEDEGRMGSGYYRPLISLSCVIDHSIWGLRPWGYHLTNVMLHCLNVLLLFSFFSKTFQDKRFVFLASLLYAVNPVHTNAVSYIMGRTDLFATVFFLSGMLMYHSFRRPGGDRKARFLIAAVIFYCLSLLSKEIAVTFPLVAILYDVCFTDLFGKNRFQWKSLITYLPFAVIMASYFLLRRLIIPEGLNLAIQSASDLMHRLATISVSILEYWKLLLFPLHLSYERSIEVVRVFSSPILWASIAGCILCIALMKRWWRQERRKIFCLLWFFIILAPVSNIVPVFPSLASTHLYTAEHFMYLPSMGLFVLAASFLPIAETGGGTSSKTGWRHTMPLVLCLVIVLDFSVLTIRRNADWRDGVTFFKNSLEKNPGSVRMMNNLGILYAERKQYDKAIPLFESALRIDPRHTGAYNNLAAASEELGLIAQAEEYRRKALLSDERNVKARVGLGRLLKRTGRMEDAMKEFLLLAQWYPDLSVVHHELGRLLAAQGKDGEALEEFQKALLNSQIPEVILNSIGIIYARRGESGSAVRYFNQALEANPEFHEAHVNLGNVYYVAGSHKNAIEEYEKALAGGVALPGIRERIEELHSISGRADLKS